MPGGSLRRVRRRAATRTTIATTATAATTTMPIINAPETMDRLPIPTGLY